MKVLKSLVVIMLMLPACAVAGEVDVRALQDEETSPPATIEALSWMQGYWVGEGFGGEAVEQFSPAAGGQMMGTFRQMNADGSPNFYEFYLIMEKAGSLVLNIKHFNPDMTGWEEKDEFVAFPLVAVEERAVYFDGLTFAMVGDDTLHAAVNVGDAKVARFSYTRSSLD